MSVHHDLVPELLRQMRELLAGRHPTSLPADDYARLAVLRNRLHWLLGERREPGRA